MSLAPSLHRKHATETNIKEQNVNGARSEATQEAGIMTDVSHTQLEADTPGVELLKPKTKIQVGSWNVRTHYQARKLQQVLHETENYIIKLLCMIEAHWIDLGKNLVHWTYHSLFWPNRSTAQRWSCHNCDYKLENLCLTGNQLVTD